MRQYLSLVRHVLDHGTRKENRTGVDTISTFNYNYEHDLRDGFPLLTTKAVSWKNIVVEMLWFLSGQTDIGILKRHGCKFWDAWADPETGKVPSAYGSFWTNFPPGQAPEVVLPREATGNDYVKSTFKEEPIETGHEWCGQTFESQKHGTFKVFRYAGTDAEGRSLFDIQFTATGYIKRSVRRDVIQQGTVRDRYAPTIHGVGYYGERTTRTAIDKDLLKVWLHMLDRCYNPECKEYPYYGLKGVTVCKRWHNFANFHADCRTLPNWINKRDNPKQYALDKDFYSAKCYSPTTCVWLPHADNRLYAHAKAVRVEYPDGEVAITLTAADAASASKLNKSRVLTCIDRGESYRGFKFSWAEGVYRKPLPNDQIMWAIEELRRNPMSRRVVISAWAPGNAQTSKLPPCHCLFVLNVQNDPPPEYVHFGTNNGYDAACVASGRTHEDIDTLRTLAHGRGMKPGLLWCPQCVEQIPHLKNPPPKEDPKSLCLHLTQRSCDVALGVPYNIASYALLLHLMSRFAGIAPGIFAHSLVDAHVYTSKPDGSMAEYDHVPGLKEQLKRTPHRLPTLTISDAIQNLSDVERLMDPGVSTDDVMKHFVLDNYDPYPEIKFKVAV